MSLVARITALAQAVGADIKALSTNVLDLAGTRRMTGPLNEAPLTTLLSMAPVDLGATKSNVVNLVYWDASITGFGLAPAGVRRTVVRTGRSGSDGISGSEDTGDITLVYHATTMRLPGKVNITTKIGDSFEMVSLGGGNWYCDWYTRADGTALVAAGGVDTTALDRAGTRQMTGALKEAPKGDADAGAGSSATLNLPAANSNTVYANGTGTVENLGAGTAGQTIRVYFQQAMTLRHSLSRIDLPGQADIVTALGDWAEFYCAGNDSWICIDYQRRNGRALAATDAPVTSVAGRTGAVVLAKADVGLDQVDNASDATKLAASLTQLQSYGVGMTQLQTTADVDAVSDTRFSRTTASTSANRPLGLNGALATMAYAANNIAQIYVTSTGRFAWRFTNNGVQGVWNEGQSVAGGLAQIQAFGLGGDTVNPLATDLNGALVSQLFRGGSSLANKPDSTSAVVGIHLPYSLTYNGQLSFGLTGTQAGKFFYRTQLNAVQGSWNEVQSVAGSLAQIQSFGLGTANTPRQANLMLAQTSGFWSYTSGATDKPNAPAGVLLAMPYQEGNVFQLAITNQGVFTRQQSGTTTPGTWAGLAGLDSPSFANSLQCAGPVRVGQYTLTTLPSASAFSGYEIDVTNATGGSKRCRSNGTVWQILNTTTTVS